MIKPVCPLIVNKNDCLLKEMMIKDGVFTNIECECVGNRQTLDLFNSSTVAPKQQRDSMESKWRLNPICASCRVYAEIHVIFQSALIYAKISISVVKVRVFRMKTTDQVLPKNKLSAFLQLHSQLYKCFIEFFLW